MFLHRRSGSVNYDSFGPGINYKLCQGKVGLHKGCISQVIGSELQNVTYFVCYFLDVNISQVIDFMTKTESKIIFFLS